MISKDFNLDFMKRFLFIQLFLFCCSLISKAGFDLPNFEIEQFLTDVYEQYTEETESEMDFTVYFEELIYLNQHPLDLNQVEREDLSKMFFLSDIQIENILYYRYKVEQFFSIYELILVEGLDMTDIRRMLPFVTLSESKDKYEKINLKQVIRFGKSELISRFDFVPELKDGYRIHELDSNGYQGNSLYNHLKYRYHYKDRLYLNVTAEKDAGEQFYGKRNKGYDFYSASVQLKNLGFIQNLIIGDYQAGFGQGLVIRQAFRTGKSALTTKVCDLNPGFKRYGSTNEFNYLRGIALTMQFLHMNVHVFYSGRKLDGNLQEDVLTGFYKTGYHRTMAEMEKKNRVKQLISGINWSYNGSWFQLGISGMMMKQDKKLIPPTYPYNLFYFKGNGQWLSGFHYRFRLQKFNFFGETAFSEMKHPAIICGISFSPVSRVNLALLYRYYAPEYDALFASAFSEGTRTCNEQGVYFGAEVLLVKNWKIAFYADSYRFPWLRYGVDFPSQGIDYLLQFFYTPSRNLTITCRTKYKKKLENRSGFSQITPEVAQFSKASIRLQSVYKTGIFEFKQQIDFNFADKSKETCTYGMLASQEMKVNFKSIPLSMDCCFLFYDAADYENRVYKYEKDILYAFSVPAHFGLGNRYYINTRYEITPGLSCWLKFSQQMYADDREFIGSGLETISGNKKTEIKLLIRLKF